MTVALSILGRGIRQACEEAAQTGAQSVTLRGVAGGDDPAVGWRRELAGDPAGALEFYERAIIAQQAGLWVFQRAAACALGAGGAAGAAGAARFYLLIDKYFPGESDAPRLAAALSERHGYRLSAAGRLAAVRERLWSVDATMEEARQAAAQGLFQQANTLYQNASADADILLLEIMQGAGEPGGNPGGATLAALACGVARRGDECLVGLLRARLADSLAALLAEKQTRSDLAWWCTGGRAGLDVLQQQFDSMRALARERPNHPEVFYRLGLLARAVGDFTLAQSSFQRVLTLQPGHAQSRARLVVGYLQAGDLPAAETAARGAAGIKPDLIKQCYQLALAFAQPGPFNRTMRQMALQDGATFDEQEVAARMAFLLRMLGLHDQQTEAWNNPHGQRQACRSAA